MAYGKDVREKVFRFADVASAKHKSSNAVVNGLRAAAGDLVKQVAALPLSTEDRMAVIRHLREHQQRLTESLQCLVAAHDATYKTLGMLPPAEGERPKP